MKFSTRIWTTLIGSVLLAACTAPIRPAPEAPPPVPVATSHGYPASAAASAEANREDAEAARLEALVPPAPPATGPEQYADLFDRMRAGFKLDDVEQRDVDVQLAWYISHPQYLDRVWERSERFMYHIVAEIEARDMPLEIALLPIVESAYEPFAFSRSRASGLWQFIPGTGTRFGLKQNWWYDGRRDVLESTRAALDYLQFLHDEFDGDWLLAIAAYNSGELNVHRAIDRNLQAGLPTDFWHLKLPRETTAYVPKLLAMKRVVKAPEDYGLDFEPIANEPYFARIDTGGQIEMAVAADLAGVGLEELTNLNPAFNRWATDPAGPYDLLVPVETAETFQIALAQLTPAQRVRTATYKVHKGDTVASVARRNNTTAAVIRELNNLRSDKLAQGLELAVPAGGAVAMPVKVVRAAALVDGRMTRTTVHVVRRGETLWGIAQRHRVSVTTLAAWNNISVGATLVPGRKLVVRSGTVVARVDTGTGTRRMTYTVRRGDTLSRISRQFRVTIAELMSWNGIDHQHQIRAGQRIVMYVAKTHG
ncbi:MAG: LysM peptidoglycan-binding domain-containing protein [Steroidobacterales bacterium]